MHQYMIHSGAVSLLAATAKSVLSWITGATRRGALKELEVSFLSVTATDVPVVIELVQFDTDGTGTTVTPVAVDRADPAAIGTSNSNYTAEPTTNAVVLHEWTISPIGGTLIYQIPLGDEIKFLISKTHTIRITAPQAQTVRVVAKIQE